MKKYIHNIILNLTNKILRHSKNKIQIYGPTHHIFSRFIITHHTASTLLILFKKSIVPLPKVIIITRLIGIILSISILAKKYWSNKIVQLFSIYYQLCIIYCLAFTPYLFFFIYGNINEAMMDMMISMILLVFLVDWIPFIVIILTGSSVAALTYQIIFNKAPVMDYDVTIRIIFSNLTFTFICGFIARRDQEKFVKVVRYNKYLRDLYQGLNMKVIEILQSEKEIKEQFEKEFIELVNIAESKNSPSDPKLYKELMKKRDDIIKNLKEKLKIDNNIDSQSNKLDNTDL